MRVTPFSIEASMIAFISSRPGPKLRICGL
jgi:hypothetical protein